MPIKRAAFKALRQNAKHRQRNLVVKQNVKKSVKAVRKAVAAKDRVKAAEMLKTAIKVLDRAAQKGVLKKNTSARLKSRLHRAIKKIS